MREPFHYTTATTVSQMKYLHVKSDSTNETKPIHNMLQQLDFIVT